MEDQIKFRRIELGLTKSEAARRAGISRGSWHEIEGGQRTQHIQPMTLHKIEKALEWPPGTLTPGSVIQPRRPQRDDSLTELFEDIAAAVQRYLRKQY